MKAHWITFEIEPKQLEEFYKTMKNEQDKPTSDTQIAVVDFNAQFKAMIPEALDKKKVENILTRFREDVSLDPDVLASALSIVVTDESQTDIIADARKMRLAFKAERVRIEHTRKDLKEQLVCEGQLIDGIARKLKDDISEAEDHLEAQERFVELQAANRRAALQTAREAELWAVEYDGTMIDLGNMHPDAYAGLLSNAKQAKADRDQAVADAEAERVRLEQERIEREAALAAENERLRIEQEEAQKEAERKAAEYAAAQAEAAWKEAEAEAAAEKAREEAAAEKARLEAEIAEKAEAARLEKERIEQEAAAEKARLEAEIVRQQKEARAEKERVEREAAEKEQARVDAENARIAKEQLEERNRQAAIKAEEDRVEAERRKAAAAPDRQKLLTWLSSIESVAVAPDMKDADIYNVAINVVDKIAAVAQDARDRVKQGVK